jgi:hypothetical protein
VSEALLAIEPSGVLHSLADVLLLCCSAKAVKGAVCSFELRRSTRQTHQALVANGSNTTVFLMKLDDGIGMSQIESPVEGLVM